MEWGTQHKKHMDSIESTCLNIKDYSKVKRYELPYYEVL